MTPRFLRDEAARFRDMADATDREASRLRLLGMADDYEQRAQTAEALAGPAQPEPVDEPSLQPPIEDAAPARVSRRIPREPTLTLSPDRPVRRRLERG